MSNPLAALQVFITMSKVGILGFGGGNAMVSLVEREVVGVRGWLTTQQFQELVGISYAVPGLSAGKIGAFVGWQQAGLLGMMAGLIGIWLPGMILMFAVFYLLRNFNETTWYPKLLKGFLFAAGGLVAATILKVIPALPHSPNAGDWVRYAIGLLIAAGVCLTLIKFKQIPPMLAVLAGGLLGLLVF